MTLHHRTEADNTALAALSLVRTFRKLACKHDREARALAAVENPTPLQRKWRDEAIKEARRLRTEAVWYLRQYARPAR